MFTTTTVCLSTAQSSKSTISTD